MAPGTDVKTRVDDRPEEQEVESADVAEHGRTVEGESTSLDRRLYMQLHAFGDLLFEKAANDTIAEFARGKIRGIVKDPATAELLCPSNVFGCKRLCVDTGYFETYNLPHVKLVDVSQTPIERFTANGIEVAGTEYAFDAIVSATGFAAWRRSRSRCGRRWTAPIPARRASPGAGSTLRRPPPAGCGWGSRACAASSGTSPTGRSR